MYPVRAGKSGASQKKISKAHDQELSPRGIGGGGNGGMAKGGFRETLLVNPHQKKKKKKHL